MGKGRALLDAVCISVTLVVVPGLIFGVHSIFANQHFSHGHDLLAWLDLSDGINRLGHPIALVVGPLLLVSVIVPLLPGKRESDALRLNVILLIAMTAVFLVSVGLRRFTDFSLSLAVERAWFRLKTGTAPATLGEGFGAIVLTYAAALVGVAIVVTITIWMNRWLRRMDLPRFDFGRWFPRRIVYPIGAAALVLAVAVNLVAVGGQLRAHPGETNVILICVDTLRADTLGYAGYERDTSPFIDTLAERSIVFKDAVSQSSWTKTSVATYITSDYSMLARVTTERHRLPRSAITLAEVLRNGGYETGAIIANPWITRKFGFDQGYAHYDEREVRSWRIETNDIVHYLDRRRSRPFFLYLHFMDVHQPYKAPSPDFDIFATVKGSYQMKDGLMPDLSTNDLAYMRALYDGEVRYLDDKLRSLFNYLDSSPLRDNTVVVFTADHGEEFFEHGGMGHGTTLYGELVDIPLLIVDYGNLDATTYEINDSVRSIDIMPTILDIAGLPVPSEVDGQSLLPHIRGRECSPTPTLAGVVAKESRDFLLSLSQNGYRYIHNVDRNHGELYDIRFDPFNLHDLIDSIPETAAEMKEALERYLSDLIESDERDGGEVDLDKETIENLKALGYL